MTTEYEYEAAAFTGAKKLLDRTSRFNYCLKHFARTSIDMLKGSHEMELNVFGTIGTFAVNCWRRQLKKRIQLLGLKKKKEISFQRKPDFLCIGAPRSGTTWLYEKLSVHPDFSLPKQKEIRFFNSSTIPPLMPYRPFWQRTPKKFSFDLNNNLHWQWYFSQFSCDKKKLLVTLPLIMQYLIFIELSWLHLCCQM